jgi:hypothetical protein
MVNKNTPNITHLTKVKEQLVVRKDMDVNELERITNVTLRHMSM